MVPRSSTHRRRASRPAAGPVSRREDRRLAIRRAALSELVPDPRNPRAHPQENLEAIVGSLRRFGQAEPLVVQKGTMRIIAGHGRLEGMKRLNWTECEIVEIDVSDVEAAALAVALNRSGELATWDRDVLARLLAELKDANAVEDIGFSGDEINELLAEMEAASADLTDPDAIPEMPDAATTRPGDLWVLGRHRLLCGDAANTDHLDRLLDGAKIHLVHTDPPYNVRVEPRSNNAIAAGLSSFKSANAIAASDARGMHHQGFDLARDKTKARASTKKLRPRDRALENDFVTDEEFVRLLRLWFGNMARVLEPGRAAYIWGGYANVANYPGPLKEVGLYFSQTIIWVKEHPVLTRKDFMGNHEWCFYSWKEGAAHYFNPKIKNATDVWSVKKVNPQSMCHLTEKPVELSVRAMTYSSRAGENVLDLFGGSGSTLIGAESLGRRAFVMELDALYCDVIVRRWEQATGRKAMLHGSSEKSFDEIAAERGVPCSTG